MTLATFRFRASDLRSGMTVKQAVELFRRNGYSFAPARFGYLARRVKSTPPRAA